MREDSDLFTSGLLDVSVDLFGKGRRNVKNGARPVVWVKIYLEVDRKSGEGVEVARTVRKCDANTCRASLRVDKPKLYAPWSPENQYVARLELAHDDSDDSDKNVILDSVEVKFGFKHLEKRVCRLLSGDLQNHAKDAAAVLPPEHRRVLLQTGARAEEPLRNASSIGVPHVNGGPRVPHPASWSCFYLNNRPLYIHGYGDDSVYPDTLSAPVTYDFYKLRTKKMHDLGFNYVRHHSHFLPAEYFSAACDNGLFVAPEGHFAYNGLQAVDVCGDDPKTAPVCDAMALRSWRSAIKQVRNHPCVFAYTMNNEAWFTRSWDLFYNAAKELDPDRWFNVDDGVFPGGSGGWPIAGLPADARSFAYLAPQFGDESLIPVIDTSAYRFPGQPPETLPLLAHEMGNVVSFPAVEKTINKFNKRSAVKPFWLSDLLQTAKSQHGGRMARAFERWEEFSKRKYLLDWKLRIEGVRKATELAGYEWWLGVTDYWAGSNGIFDHFSEPKFSEDQLRKQILPRNADVMLLVSEIGDNLPSDRSTAGDTSIFLRAYESADVLKTSIWLSDRGPKPVSGGVLTWRVESLAGEHSAKSRKVLCEGKVERNLGDVVHDHVRLRDEDAHPDHLRGHFGEERSSVAPYVPKKLADISCALPDLGTFVSNPQQAPLQLELHAEFQFSAAESSSSDNEDHVSSSNHWSSRLYPKYEDGPVARLSPAVPARIFTPTRFCNALPFSDLVCSDDPVAAGFCYNDNTRRVFVTDRLESGGPDGELLRCVAAMKKGLATVLLISSNAADNAGPFFERFPARFKTQWWMGNGADRNMGSFLDVGTGHDHDSGSANAENGVEKNDDFWSGVLAEESFLDDGLVDDTWHRLVEGGAVFVLEKFAQVGGAVFVLEKFAQVQSP